LEGKGKKKPDLLKSQVTRPVKKKTTGGNEEKKEGGGRKRKGDRGVMRAIPPHSGHGGKGREPGEVKEGGGKEKGGS